MCPIGYYEMMRNCKDLRHLRLKMVRYAQEHSNKEAARVFQVQVKIVRKWRRRYEEEGYAGLADRSRAPIHPAVHISPEERKKAIDYKRRLRTFGAERIKEHFGLSISVKAIRRIWREAGLLTHKRRKHKTKNDLRAIKKHWELFEQSGMDTKHLYDIPEYWPQMKLLNLPRYQYTFREVVSGLQFLAYGAECSITYAAFFARKVLDHLQRCGVKFDQSRIQTDNGTEFIGSWQAREDSIFTKLISSVPGLSHHTIPTAAHTWQADVETVHSLIENEFYCVERFSSRFDFWKKAAAYLLWFNTVRPNSYKGGKSPWQIIHERDPSLPHQIVLLPPIMLDECFRNEMMIPLPENSLDHLPQRGYDVVPGPLNSREAMLSENTTDIVNLLYKNGVIYFNELCNYERARESFLQILSIVHHHIPSLLYLERIYLQEKATSKIIDLYTSLLQSATADSKTKEFYLTRLAIIYREQGEIKKAIDTFRLVAYLYPDSTVAKENLRLLAGEVDFQEFTLDYFEGGEIYSILTASGNDRQALVRLESTDPSFYKYLWEKKVSGDSTVSDSALEPPELTVRTVLEKRESIDLLARHADSPAMLTLLAQHYLEKGYLKGIYTILSHYLSLSPATKSALWSIFFMGADHPELKEKLNSILVSATETEHFEIALSILEKMYLRQKDYKTVLFLRMLFVKKLRNRDLQRRFLDDTISLLKDFLEPADLLDLYKERYLLSEGTDRTIFLSSYGALLASFGMYDNLTNLYAEAWRSEGTLDVGMSLLDLFISRHETEKAIALSDEILSRYPSASGVLTRLADFLETTHRSQQAHEILQRYLTTTPNETLRKDAFDWLLRYHLKNDSAAEVVSLFHTTPFGNRSERFERGIEIAERLLLSNHPSFALQIIQTLHSSSPEEALRKAALTLRCGACPLPEDLILIPSYAHIHPFTQNIQNEEALFELLRHFASRHDAEAVVWLAKRLLERNHREEARRIIGESAPFLADKHDILHALALRAEDRTYEEKDILCQNMLACLQREELYPAERLLELIHPTNYRARFFIQNLLAFLRLGRTKQAMNEWHYLSVMREDIILAQAGFTPIDQKLRVVGRLLAPVIAQTKATEHPSIPLTSASNRHLFSLVEKLSLAIRAETLRAFWDEMGSEPLTVDYKKGPVLLFSPLAEKVSSKTLAFQTAAHYFLTTSGATSYSGKTSIQELVERLTWVFSLPSQEQKTILRSLRKHDRDTVTALIEELRMVTPALLAAFAERLYLAALLYAFTIIPDIAQVSKAANETSGHLDVPDSAIANAYALAITTFFE